MSRPGGCGGATLVEVVVSLLLGVFLLGLCLRTVGRGRAAQASLVATAEALAALRVGRHVLRAELRMSVPARDWGPLARDSLPLRAFRGVALVCPARPSDRELLVTVDGRRLPDALKDSVLLLTSEGRWVAYELEEAEPTALRCPADAERPVQRWRLAASPEVGVALARYFERGSYHLSDGALRYRSGAGGRQPLTPEVLDTRDRGFTLVGDGLSVELAPVGPRVPWSGRLAAVR